MDKIKPYALPLIGLILVVGGYAKAQGFESVTSIDPLAIELWMIVGGYVSALFSAKPKALEKLYKGKVK